MPVVAGGVGVCHTYVDRTADFEKAANIILNAKVQRPTVCNALDTVLLHSEAAPGCLPVIARNLSDAGVELHCDHRALSILGPEAGLNTLPATEEDWGKEYLSLTAAIKVVDSLDEALEHIETYGSGHTEAIITGDAEASRTFPAGRGCRGRHSECQHPVYRRRSTGPGRRSGNQHPEVPRQGPPGSEGT